MVGAWRLQLLSQSAVVLCRWRTPGDAGPGISRQQSPGEAGGPSTPLVMFRCKKARPSPSCQEARGGEGTRDGSTEDTTSLAENKRNQLDPLNKQGISWQDLGAPRELVGRLHDKLVSPEHETRKAKGIVPAGPPTWCRRLRSAPNAAASTFCPGRRRHSQRQRGCCGAKPPRPSRLPSERPSPGPLGTGRSWNSSSLYFSPSVCFGLTVGPQIQVTERKDKAMPPRRAHRSQRPHGAVAEARACVAAPGKSKRWRRLRLPDAPRGLPAIVFGRR